PESNHGAGRAMRKHALFQKFIENADPAVFDDEVTFSRTLQQGRKLVTIAVDNALHVGEIAGVVFLLAAIGIRLSEGNVVAERVKLLVHAAVIGSGPVPIRGGDAGAEGKNSHRPTSSKIAISSRARCAQVWRVRMLFNPFSAS